MKKIVTGILIVFVTLLLCSWLLIPSSVRIESQVSFKASPAGLIRRLSEKGSLATWWPGEKADLHKTKGFLYHGTSYDLNVVDMTLMSVVLTRGKTVLKTRLYLFALAQDSSRLVWLGSIPVSGDPVSKLFNYLQARVIKSDTEHLLEDIQAWYAKPEHVYGSVIHTVPVSDTSMIAIFSSSKGYPSNASIYAFISKLQAYASENGAAQSGYPMVNIRSASSTDFKVEVALPINKVVTSSAEIIQKRLPPGKILETEIKGGFGPASQAIDQIKNYGADHHLSMYVIPYFSLVTNRITEPDSTKWVTRVYCPIF